MKHMKRGKIMQLAVPNHNIMDLFLKKQHRWENRFNLFLSIKQTFL